MLTSGLNVHTHTHTHTHTYTHTHTGGRGEEGGRRRRRRRGREEIKRERIKKECHTFLAFRVADEKCILPLLFAFVPKLTFFHYIF